MDQYAVSGMSCAACSSRVEKAVSKVDGVTSCSVSLLTNSMGVEGTASPSAIIKAVTDAGYGAKQMGVDQNTASASARLAQEEAALEDHETPVLKRRLITSIGFLLVLMYFSMGHMMWGWPLPHFFDDNHVAMGLVQLLLTICVMIINKKFFVNGFKGLLHRAPNMDTLVALGSGTSFVYSVYALFRMTDAQVHGGPMAAMKWMDQFYFESAAMILTLITVGKMLEAMSKGRTTDALKGLMKLAPKTATLFIDGKEQTVPIDQVKLNDIFVVKPGENIPVDGIIVEGSSAVNEAALTGESIPVDKAFGDEVSAATVNQSGYLRCRATRVGQDTTLSQIIQMVSDAAATKAPIAKIADEISGIFVPAVITVALITFVVWMFMGQPVGFSLSRAISVLVVSCPCALGLATPVAIMVGNGMGAKHGTLFKTAASLEATGRTQIIALDKTGTITNGKPKVTDIIVEDGVTKEDLVSMAYALEQKSEHPLSKAIIEYVQSDQSPVEDKIYDVKDFQALPGNGLSAKLDGAKLAGGNYEFISSQAQVSEEIKKQSEELAEQGKTPLFFARDQKLIGIIAVADVLKDDSAQAIKELTNMGIHVVMLTGDNERTAKAIGREAGVSEVVAGVRPEGKEEVIRKLKEHGKVAMVGDGINDAPALTRADIGIAIGAGTDVAIDAADVVLMRSKLSDVAAAVRLSRATLRNIHENLFWAFFYNVILIPIAAGFYAHWGLTMNPMFGAAAMSLSSFCVVTNALRLNLFKMESPDHDKKMKNAVTGPLLTDYTDNKEAAVKAVAENLENADASADSTRTIRIEGMMCGHCEATVKNALEAFDHIDEASADHEKGIAVIKTSGPIDEDAVRAAIEDKDYKFISISKGEQDTMANERTINIKGMMCPHCEATVKKTLEAFDTIDEAVVSHESGTAVIKTNGPVDEEAIKAAIDEKGYEFVSM